ncbi:MAG: hypothetical protein QOK10_1959 [Pseudonocardiales bacterium]|jgi:hypothetical protein|nr:hypothetical protein [Pseudonocardiales bacterium]
MTPRPAEGPATIELPAASARGLRVAVLPELGAKVTSLRLTDGREWLAQPVRPLAAPAHPDQDWAELDCSGWDECFPNIAPSQALGLRDHGEVWRHPWSARMTAAGLRTEIRTGRYRFARELTSSGNQLVADYLLRNESPQGGAELDWAWAQHPLLAVDESTRLLLPGPARVRLDACFGDAESAAGIEWLCPSGLLEPETLLGVAQGRAAKLWFERPLPPVIAVLHEDEWLAWKIADPSIDEVGLWINLGGWGGTGDTTFRHLAIEPAFGGVDDPEIAYAGGVSRRLPAASQRRWRVVIEAGRGRPALTKLLAAVTLPN